MRMWMIPTYCLCNKHLIGEHGELHKFHHNFVKKHSIKGRISPKVQIQPLSMKDRHDALVEEMVKRGMCHNSPYKMPDLTHLPLNLLTAKVDILESVKDLIIRCPACKMRIIQYSTRNMSLNTLVKHDFAWLTMFDTEYLISLGTLTKVAAVYPSKFTDYAAWSSFLNINKTYPKKNDAKADINGILKEKLKLLGIEFNLKT